VRDKDNSPCWANLYGAPISGEGQYASLMNIYGDSLGSHYRGRFMYKISTGYERNPKTVVKRLTFSFPRSPYPQVEQVSYLLRVDVLEAHELSFKKEALITVAIGPYIV